MKILIALTYYAPYMSGVSEYARMLAEDLAGRHEITVLTTQHDESLPRSEVIKGVRVIRAPVFARLHKGVVSAAFLTEFARLAREADVVNLHLPMLESGLLSLMMPRRKLVVNYHCDMAVTGGMLDRLAVTVTRLSCWISTWRASRVAVTTLDYANSSRWIGGTVEKRREVFAPVKSFPETRSYGSVVESPATPFRFGFVGRFVEEKGLPVLLAAFAQLRARHGAEVRLVLAGDHAAVAGGGILDRIHGDIAALGDAVEVLGRVSEQRLQQVYDELDVLVLPSVNRYEAYGMVQLEAMFAGARVIASDLPGVRTIVQRSGNGRIVARGDSDALLVAMEAELVERGTHSRDDVWRAAFEAYPVRRFYELEEAVFRELTDA